MENSNKLLKNLRKGKTVFGLSMSYSAYGIIEGICPGWDFVWIDGQHGEFSYDTIVNCCRTSMAVGVDSIIRVPGHERGIIAPVADVCPSAIMVPMVNNPEQAKSIVDITHFYPSGNRSFGARRAIDIYGRTYINDYEICIIAQIETPQAVNNANTIAEVEGIDMLFFGAEDLRIMYGLPHDSNWKNCQKIKESLEKTAYAAKNAGKFAGCIAVSREDIGIFIDMGYNLIVYGSDVMFLRTQAQARLKEIMEFR